MRYRAGEEETLKVRGTVSHPILHGARCSIWRFAVNGKLGMFAHAQGSFWG